MKLLIFLAGVSGGIFAAAGVAAVFMVLNVVSVISYKSSTENKIKLYETCICFGTILCNLWYITRENLSKFYIFFGIETKFTFLLVTGIFMGVYVGCISMLLDEAMDASAVFLEKIKIKTILKYTAIIIALGKMTGNYLYFLY